MENKLSNIYLKYNSIITYGFLVALCICVYIPSLSNNFIFGWDDQWMVTNSYTEGGWTIGNIWSIFSEFYGGQYSPLNQFNYLIVYTLFGYDPLYFHLYSLLLHIGCVCLVWKFVYTILHIHGELKDKQILFMAWITSLLFAIHPINVEPIAWISASKVPLYAFFYLMGLLSYLEYVKTQKVINYLITIICFLFSFGGKEQAVTFPLALLVVDWFINRDMKSCVVWNEKLPFFMLAFLFGVITILSQGNGSYGGFPFYQRLVFACYALIEYITKSLFPIRLNFFYPFPIVLGEELPLRFCIYPILLFLLIAWAWVYRKNKFLIFGILIFVVNLVLSIHILNMSRHSIIADRYLYLSYIGVSFLIGYGSLCIKNIFLKLKFPLFLFVLYIFCLSIQTLLYAGKWKDTEKVKEYTKEVLKNRLKQSE